MTGKSGYVKDKDLFQKEIKRTNMMRPDFSSSNPDLENAVVANKNVITEEALSSFIDRKKVVDKIINEIISKERFTVNIDLERSVFRR